MTDILTNTEFRTHVDPEGRRFEFALVRHPGTDLLGISFSAFFFGKAGKARPYRENFSGYFHRLRMLGSDDRRNWLFICDAYGADGDGCYYAGQQGDLFVERAVQETIMEVAGEVGADLGDAVTVGSSMGATGAVKFGLMNRVRGIVAVAPHLDLDISAAMQGRMRHVAFICPDGDPLAEHNRGYTRQIRSLIGGYVGTLPRLFVQSCADDRGVFMEQVVPIVDLWSERGGLVDLDVRPVGGHTSDFATGAVLLDVIERIQCSQPIPVEDYQTLDRFRGKRTRPPVSLRVRNSLGSLRNRVLRRGY